MKAQNPPLYVEKPTVFLSKFFSNLQIKVGLEKIGLQLEMNRARNQPKDTIVKVLTKLHALAEQKNIKLVFFLDEFQVVGEVTQDYAIEAALREVAQKSTHIAYIFSGSNRHLLEEMFFDKKRPFYNLCDTMRLDRISSEKYVPHINKAAKKVWKAALDEKTFQAIFNVTQNHPYYINRLCNLLLDEDLPNEKTVYNVWSEYVQDNQSSIESKISELPLNQRKVLILLASIGPVEQLYASSLIKNSDLSSGSMSRVIKALKEKDYIYVDAEGRHCILDPLIDHTLRI